MIKKIRVFFWQLLKHPSILLVYCAWNKSEVINQFDKK